MDTSALLPGIAASNNPPRNGETADILNGGSGKLYASGFDQIPSRGDLEQLLNGFDCSPLPPDRLEMEARIVYAFEIDGGCPCDDTACRIA